MANDLVKVPPKLDGFDGFENGTEGEEQRGSLTRGQTIKFTNNYTWITRDGEELSPHLELVVVDQLRIVQRRHVDGPAENRILEPLQKFPDIEKMNEETLRSEWVEGPDGQLRGPYQRLYVIYLVNPLTMDCYTYYTSTIGGGMCANDIAERTKLTRRFRGAQVYPAGTLSDTFMHTRAGGRQRPHLIVKRWILLGGDGRALSAPMEPSPKFIDGVQENVENKPAIQSPPQSDAGVRTVEPPSYSEELGDEIPSNGSAGKGDRNTGSRAPTVRTATAKSAAKKPFPERARSRA